MTDAGRTHPSFSLPVFRSYTGKLQFRVDGAAEVATERGNVKRGEVISVGNPEYANGLVDGGQFAHVDASTPLGPSTLDED